MNWISPETIALLRDVAPIVLPALIALIALFITVSIQRQHSSVLAARLKVDLFEKRYEFLQLIRNITTISLTNDERYFEKMHREYAKFTHFKLLFPRAIADSVDKVIQSCDELWVSSESLRKLDAASSEGERERRTNTDLRRSIRDDMVSLQSRIEDFIRVDWAG